VSLLATFWQTNLGSLQLDFLLQIDGLHIFSLLAEAAPDDVPTSTRLAMAERALRELSEGIHHVTLQSAVRTMRAVCGAGKVQQEHQERVISLCIQALQLHGACPPAHRTANSWWCLSITRHPVVIYAEMCLQITH
jgi:hypothetical protein